MCYESPVEVIVGQMRITSEIHLGKEIIKAVQKFGVNVNKAELLKALAYDREQYEKGYVDRDNEIIRCKDCIYYTDCLCWNVPNNESPRPKEGTFFCSDGRRKGGEQG